MKNFTMDAKKTVLLALIIPFLNIAYSQVTTNVQGLQKLSEKYAGNWQNQVIEVRKYAQEKGIPVRSVLPDGKVIEMVDVKDGKPVYYTTENLGAAATTRASELWTGGSLGLNLDGSGYTGLGEWDAGAVRATHNEFTSGGTQPTRIIQADGATTISDHATHVAGTLVAQGYSASAKGMSNKGTLRAYDWNNDNAEMASAAANGLEISNHSYGYVHGWHWNGSAWTWYGSSAISTQEDYNFGLYTSDARDWDDVAYNAPNYLIVKSAGNDRGEGPTSGAYPQDGAPNGYDCIGTQAVAKNILTVGAVNGVANYTGPSSVVMSSFSSWGPADDGRIKPDIVGKGVGLYSSVGASNTAYASYSGTSMSSPNVAGTLGLLQQHYKNNHGGQSMRAATLKALIINTADECGDNPGPDYKFGWGLLNAKKAAQLITKDAVETNVIDELALNNGSVYTIDFNSDGTQPLIVTIVWTDPAGTAMSNVLDPANTALVNDLDLRVINGVNNFLPYKLDRINPAAAATSNTENNVDNVELINIANPAPGVYTVRIDHDGTLAASQQFSLVVSGANAAPPVNDDAGISNILAPSGTICSATVNPEIVLTNYGLNSLTSVTVKYQVDSNPLQTYLWTGNLASAASQNITLSAISVGTGSHSFTVFSGNPNGTPDNKPQNDQNISVFSNGYELTLKIVFDNYPEETSWNITDANNKIVASGGGYGNKPDGSTVIENICAPGGCLNFNIFDAYSDGMCCSFGNGSYQLKENASGTILANGGAFGASETTPFCIPKTNLAVSVISSGNVTCGHTSDGFATALATGGTGNYTYTWSNGQTGATASNLSAGNFSVTVNDGQNTANASVTISDPNLRYFRDIDGDRYGNQANSQLACSQPSGYVLNSTDCNDTNATIYPGAPEICDGMDNDCDGSTDEGCVACTYETINFNDFESGLGIWVDGGDDCQRIAKYPISGSYSVELRDNTITSLLTTTSQDFSEYNELTVSFSYYPSSMDDATEDFWLQISTNGGVSFATVEEWNFGDEFVNNQRYNGQVKINGPFTQNTQIRFRCDASGDADWVYIDDVKIEGCKEGAGNNPPVAQFSAVISCLTVGFTDNSSDTDGTVQLWNWDFGDGSNSSLQNPTHVYAAASTYQVNLTVTDNLGATAISSQNITTSPLTAYYRDADVDGYGNADISQPSCSQPTGYVLNNTDCNDANATIYPGAPEICDGLDNDCDGQIDENLILTYYYQDADGDGFGNPAISQRVCLQPSGFILNNTDCNDANASIHPGATEICGDGIDNNCDGNVDEGCVGCTYETINSNNFDTGFGIWTDGGADCRRIKLYPNSGLWSVELRDNTASSVMTTSDLNLSLYNELKIQFSYYPVNMDNSTEDFWLQVSTNGGVNYTTVEEWNQGDEFQNNNRYNVQVIIAGPFTSATRIRFRCDASDDLDLVYIDDVQISGCRKVGTSEIVLKSGESKTVVSISTKNANTEIVPETTYSLKVYPNPFNNEIFVSIDGSANYEKVVVTLMDITGKLMFNKVYGNQREIVIRDLHLAPGSYFIRVQMDEFVKTEHLIKTK